jgi:phage baseplate assembly protein W
MPLEGVSQGFRDVSASFQSHPLTNDLIGLKNASAIARSVRNIVLTSPGEKFFNPNFGSKISDSLFENFDDLSALTIKDEIENSIRRFEPRVILDDIKVSPDFDNNSFDVLIVYRIVGIDIPQQQLEFVLESTR